VDEAVQRIAGAWEHVLPEIVLVATACVCFLAGPFLVSERGEAPAGLRHRWGGIGLAGLLTAAALWWRSDAGGEVSPLGPFRLDDLAWFVRGLSIAAGVILLLTSWNRVEDARAAEHHACLLLIVAGVSLVGAANDLVTLFLALELVSIPTYVLLYLGRHDATGQEAVLKYFLLSVFSSALVLFGLSYFYGVAGTTNLTAMYEALAAGAVSPALFMAAAAVIAGLGFRVTAVPFHFYAPDVFQGAAMSGAALLSFVPKIAGFVALLRLLSAPAEGLRTLGEAAEPILWSLAVVSMTVGNVLALLQTDVRRLMAYSSIAHAGYMLVGLAAAPHDGAVRGAPALLFYLAAYGAMTVGVFAVLAAVRSARSLAGSAAGSEEKIDDLAGLSQTHPAAALLMTVFLFSLTGLPPTAGFLGKLNLFLAAWSAGSTAAQWTAVVMAINAAIGAWYYLRLIGVMYLQRPAEAATRPVGSPAFIGAALCAAATILLFAAPDWLWQAVSRVSG
jgi:NADH-quinone oxidoreductase subunit N